ncbi:uncharacterized protein LOC129953463, partial [Eupeodes corollae]|uniref:uncharacterized protein LOC129953463 n=1 Tax=Eupeodes corollae TaxID=290404 RepID=UPI00249260F1
MGGMVVLLAGDFRQTLPVIQRGTPADEIQACIKSSSLWPTVKKLRLKTNMRVHLHNDVDSGLYAEMINTDILNEFQGEKKEYLSMDTIMDTELSTSYPVEFLNSLEPSGVPSHKLQLKLNVPVILMRNLDAPRLCNGTKLRITKLGQNILGATILTGV